MGEPAASCLWLQPACHYDDSVAYQCLPQIYLSGTRLWPRIRQSLAPVHPSASEVLLWRSGRSLSVCLAHTATWQKCLRRSFSEYWDLSATQCQRVEQCAAAVQICRARETLYHCWCSVNVLTPHSFHQGKSWQSLLGLKRFRESESGRVTLLMVLVKALLNKQSNY